MSQENVDSFTVSATKCARRMATFVKILNKEDISTMDNRDNIREVTVRFSFLSHFLVVSSNKEGICSFAPPLLSLSVGAFNKECPSPNFVTISRNSLTPLANNDYGSYLASVMFSNARL